MLSKHFEKVRQKSENYRMVCAFTVSLLFTGVIAGLWGFSFFIPNFNSGLNSASIATAIDGDLSPTGVVKQEAGNIIDSFWNTVKGVKNNPYTGGQYEVKPTESGGTFSTTTSSGITVEVDNTDTGGENDFSSTDNVSENQL
jgi:hypothetical protein